MGSSRSQRRRIALETVEILERGWYDSPSGQRVDLASDLEAARTNTVLYRPDEVESLRSRERRSAVDAVETRFRVSNETSLAAARDLVDETSGDVLVLNFASAKNPGGGFLGGSQAQEESLARASGLYACISPMREMYDHNRALRNCLYSDYTIHSPAVPVFRNDEDELLERPYAVSFLTSPAVNRGAIAKNRPRDLERVSAVMRKRIDGVLAIAAARGHESLVLGAWGCGVFRNDPYDVARWFHDALHGAFAGRFRHVDFAILDTSEERRFIGPFESAFGAS